MDLKHLDLDICFTPNLGGPTTRMLTKSQVQSLCCVAWTLVPAVGSAEVCQAQKPCQHDELSRVLSGVKPVSTLSSQTRWTLVTDSFVESGVAQSVNVTYFGVEIAGARVQDSALSSLALV